MSWVRSPATVRAGITGSSSSARRVCSAYSPSIFHSSIASVISTGTVPRSSPTTVVPVRAASAAITASSFARG